MRVPHANGFLIASVLYLVVVLLLGLFGVYEQEAVGMVVVLFLPVVVTAWVAIFFVFKIFHYHERNKIYADIFIGLVEIPAVFWLSQFLLFTERGPDFLKSPDFLIRFLIFTIIIVAIVVIWRLVLLVILTKNQAR